MGRDFGVLIDSGCKVKNFLKGKIAKEAGVEVYPATLRVAFEGGGKGIAEYFCVLDEVEIKLNESQLKLLRM